MGKDTLADLLNRYHKAVEELCKSKEYTYSQHSFTPHWSKQRERNQYYPVGKELKGFTVVIEMVRKDKKTHD